MAPLVAMIVGSVVRTVVSAVGGGVVAASATSAQVLPVENELQAAIGALLVAVVQVWSILQKKNQAAATE